jgi:hypothetical protein
MGDKIPENFTINIIPAAQARLIVPVSLHYQLEDALSMSAKNPADGVSRREMMQEAKGDQERINQIAARFRDEDSRKNMELLEVIKQLPIFFDVKDPAQVWVTQHDIENAEMDLYMHEAAKHLTTGQMQSLMTVWRTLLKSDGKRK